MRSSSPLAEGLIDAPTEPLPRTGCCESFSMKAITKSLTRAALGSIALAGKKGDTLDFEPDRTQFVVAFCGSGTGHMTQALAFVKLLKARGLTLCGVITGTDMASKLIEENITPLGAPLLVLPAITIVNKDGVLPPHRVLAKARAAERGLKVQSARILEFLAAAKPGILINMWQIRLGKFLQQNPLPPSVLCLTIAAQCGQAAGAPTELRISEITSVMAAAAKGTCEVMCRVFAGSGPLVAITASGKDGCLAPIIEIPDAISNPPPSPLLLCYFLTQAPARKLEKLLHQNPIPNLEVHVFTPEALTAPKGRELSLHSHPKQRALFQELFAKCTGVICSTGNETIWEATCRGVPVLTVPTAGHGEQMLNAVTHARALPSLVRTRKSLKIADVRWLVEFVHTEESRRESATLRERCAALAEGGGGVDELLAQQRETAAVNVVVSP